MSKRTETILTMTVIFGTTATLAVVLSGVVPGVLVGVGVGVFSLPYLAWRKVFPYNDLDGENPR